MRMYFLRLCVPLLLLAILLCSLGACSNERDKLSAPLSEATALSLSVLTEQLGLEDVSAMDVLVQLRRAGFEEAVRMAFVEQGADDDDTQTVRLWLESAAVEVVIGADGLVSRIQNGDRVFYVQEMSNGAPTVPPTGDDSQKGEMSTPTPSTPTPSAPTDSQPPAGSASDPADDPIPPQPNVPPPTGDKENGEKTLKIISLTTPLQAGKKATLVACGVAGEVYDISVRYASGESTAQGLEPQIADPNGELRWSFRVAARVAAGEYPVTVSGGGETITVALVVE